MLFTLMIHAIYAYDSFWSRTKHKLNTGKYSESPVIIVLVAVCLSIQSMNATTKIMQFKPKVYAAGFSAMQFRMRN